MEIGNQKRHMLIILLIVFLAFMSSMTSVAIAQETSYSIDETQITTNGKAILPDIYGDKIAYIVYHDNGYLGDIYLYDLSTEHENLVATDDMTIASVDVYGDRIVWTHGRDGNYDVYMYDISTSQITQITNDGKSCCPKIYGDKIVYQSGSSYSDIYIYDISTSQKTQIISSVSTVIPDIYADKIVWCEGYNIYMYDISTGHKIQITYSGKTIGAHIYGDQIAWSDNENKIHIYDISTSMDTTITSTNYSNVPAIYKDRVVWSDYHDSHSSDDIFMYNISTSEKTQITTSGHSRDPNIFGNRIVYRNYGGTVGFGTDIYMSTLTIQESTEGSLVQVQGSTEVYRIENSMKRHFTSPEALEWNGYSFSDVIEISSETLASIPAGADISITQAIIDKYHALGGSPIFGPAVSKGELNGEPDSAGNYCSYVNFQKGAIDCFKNGPHVGEAYAIFNPLFTKWGQLGYGAGILGYPIEAMSEPQTSKYGTSFRYQNFANGDELGALELNLSSGNVIEIHGAIFAKWSTLDYADSVLGLVTSDERDAVTSFKGTTGKVSDFEKGHLHWHGSGDHYMATYMTYGELDDLYASVGGTASELGFPIMDQEEREGHGYCEFEGGTIEWDDTTGNYKVKLSIAVGQGADTLEIEQLFIDAYNRNGGLSVLGEPTTLVHEAFGYHVQDFPGASGIPGGVIMYNPIRNNASYIHGAIWNMYYNYPNKAQLGQVAEDEKEAAKSPQGTTGRYTKFQTGTIHWISNENDANVGHPQRDKAFATYGRLDEVYTNLGGTHSDLGFPIMNQTLREDGHEYCEFEGGKIEWNDNSGDYQVELNFEGSSTPLTIKISSPHEGDSFKIGEVITFHGDIIGGNSPYTCNWVVDVDNHVEVTTNLYSEFIYDYHSQNDLGEHTVKLQISDSQGNIVQSAPVKFRVAKKVAVIPAKFSDSSTISSPSLGTIQNRIDLIQQYYYDQSYGKVPIDFDFYICNTESDSWFKLPCLTSEFENTWPFTFKLLPLDSGDYRKRISIWREACAAAGITINQDISTKCGYSSKDYDTVVVLFPVDFRSESCRNDVYSICSASESYGNWAHELGHSLFDFTDKAGTEMTGGNIGYWGLMGLGHSFNPPTPIIGFEKNQCGWLKYKEVSFSDVLDSGNEYEVPYLDDSKLTEEGLLKLNTRLESNVKYFLFEGRREKDGVKTETTSSENYPLFDGSDKGISAYQIEYKSGMDQIFRVPPPISLNRKYKLTIPVGESIKLDEGTLKATCLSDGDKLKVMLEPIKPVELKVFSSKVTLPNFNSLWNSVPDNSSLDVDLHVTTNDGKHVGMNYTEDVYCNEIEGAETSGNILGGGSEWISLPENVEALAYVTVSPDLESLLKSNDSLAVEVTSTLTVYDENSDKEISEPVNIKINSENIDGIIPISFNSNSPASITNLQSISGIIWLNFTWVNPEDSDFNHTEIYLDGIFQTNTSSEYFNITGLQPSKSYTISTRTVDIYGNVNQTWVNLTETTLPMVDFTANSTSGDEPLNVKFTDYSTDAALWEWDFGDGTPISHEQNPLHIYAENGEYTVTLTVTDDDGGVGTDTLAVIVNNVNPVIDAIVVPIDPCKMNTPVATSSTFTDGGILDTHTAVWDFGDGSTLAGFVTETNGAGTVTGEHTYTSTGIYRVALTVTDDDGGSATMTSDYAVVYNPDGGFVTGGRWIDSPEGAYVQDSTLTGKATFEFASTYTKKATKPTGITMFQLKMPKSGNGKSIKTTNLNFKSTSYDWLVVSGNQAKCKGTGTINGKGNYDFMISIVDGKNNRNDIDKFRIKIWDKASGEIVYDNQIGASEDAEPTTVIGGGSIVIHKEK